MISERPERTEIRLAGFGGQGVVLAGLLLGQAAVNDGLYAAGSSSYGAQARGSACRADVVVSGSVIDYPHLELADLFVAMSQGAFDAYLPQVSPEGMVFYDKGLVTVSGGAERIKHGLDVTEAAVKEMGNKQVANLIWVGVVASATGLFTPEGVEKAARQHLPGRLVDLNLKALARGFQMGAILKEA